MRDGRLPLVAACLAACVLALGTAPAVADDGGSLGGLVTPLQQGRMDLLPFDDIQLQDFNKENGVLLSRTRALQRRVESLAKKYRKRKNKNDKEGKKLLHDIRRLRIQITALHVPITEALLAAGVDAPLIAYMNKAPTGARRAQRYAYGLVLLLPDLDADQRALFERATSQVEAAEFAIQAQKERTALALAQTKLEKPEQRQIAGTFDRQLRLIEQRYWQLTDYALSEPQRAQLWRWLPRAVKRKSQPVEHLYALPDLTPSQGTRLRALLTEVEHESSPDNATVKRVNAELRKKGLAADERTALTKERQQAYQRLSELRRYGAKATREILTDAQWLAYEAVPPRVSANDRKANYRRVLEGWTPDAAQAKRIKALSADMRKAQREIRKRTADLARQRADYGADSPQMAGMQMEMQGMQAEGQRHQRAYVGRIFTEVMTDEQVSRWLMGHYGYKR
jgi:hypothetical protein